MQTRSVVTLGVLAAGLLLARPAAAVGDYGELALLALAGLVLPAQVGADIPVTDGSETRGDHFWVFNVPGFVGTIGAFGQQMFINRELGLVVVFTANLPSEQANTIFEGIIRDYVVPAVR